MSVHTRSQKLAQAAFPAVQNRKETLDPKGFGDYTSFAKKFPALVHACGLAQAVAFAVAKKETEYLTDLAAVLKGGGHTKMENGSALAEQTRCLPVSGYLRLSRDAIDAASWLKRYVEALGDAS